MSEKMMNYILLGVKGVIGVAGVIIFIMIIMGEQTNEANEKLHSVGSINAGLVLSYIVTIVCLLAWLVFGVWNIVANIKKSIPLLISVGIFGVLFAISYALSSDEIMETWKKKPDLFTPGNIKWSDVGIYIMYFMLVLTILSIVVSEIVKIFK